MQDQESGAAGNSFGRQYGAKVIERLGATPTKKGSNECLLENMRVSVHCARKHTKSVGVTKLCLERLDAVVGAFEQGDGSFQIIKLDVQTFRDHATPTRSLGASAGRVVLVTRSVFIQYGQKLKTLHFEK